MSCWKLQAGVSLLHHRISLIVSSTCKSYKVSQKNHWDDAGGERTFAFLLKRCGTRSGSGQVLVALGEGCTVLVPAGSLPVSHFYEH